MKPTEPIQRWVKGVDNVHVDHELPPDALRAATNVDVLDTGKIRSRTGFSALNPAFTMVHSLKRAGDRLYAMRLGNLYSISATGIVTFIATGLQDTKTDFVRVGTDTYFSNLGSNGMIRNDVLYSWGVEIPSNLGVTITQGAGVLPVGAYHVVFTYVDSLGRESAASPQLAFSGGGSLQITLPTPSASNTVTTRIYVTECDGEVLYRAAELPSSTMTYSVQSVPQGIFLRTEAKGPMPMGDCLAHTLGRIFIAVGKFVYFTDGLAYHLIDPSSDYYAFAEKTSVVDVRDGIYVLSDAIYFIEKPGTAAAAQRKVASYRGFHGSIARLPNSTDSMIMTERGAMQLSDGGEVKILADGRYIPGTPTSTAAFVREERGVRQYVCAAGSVKQNNLAIGA